MRGKVVAYKAGTEHSALFETELALDGGRGAVISAGGYAWALACDHLEIVHCRGTHMNLMTPESEGGDLLETIAPHLSYELARAWSDVAPVESTVAESIVESPSTLDRCDDDDALSRAALARLRASGELRASAPGRRWNRHEWHPSLRLPAWTRPGTVVETFAGSNGAAGFDSPRSISPSATSSWDSTIARGDWRGSTTPTTRRDGAFASARRTERPHP